MAERRRALFYRRTFLNRPRHHGLGAVLAEVVLISDAERPLEVEAAFEVSDCGRIVRLDFSVYAYSDRGTAANVLHKARLLSDTAARFADALENAIAEQEADRRRP